MSSPSPNPSPGGKVALITGGGSGIGRSAAIAFARADTRVVVSDVDEAGGWETVQLVNAAGGEAFFVRADVSRAGDVGALVQAAVATYGRLDCAFNNAGITGPSGPVADVSEDDWDRVMAINLKGVFLGMKYEIPQMLRQGGGVIVNNASVYGLRATPTSPAYVASKHAVIGLTKSAAIAYAQAGVRVNAVCPGFVDTPLLAPYFERQPELRAAITAMHPIGRLGTSEEVAAAVVWLCSDAASFVTGSAMVVDGGFLA